jgi:hypothetical protein
MAIRFTRAGLILSVVLVAGSAFAASREENLADPIVGVEDAVLADAPNVPPPTIATMPPRSSSIWKSVSWRVG